MVFLFSGCQRYYSFDSYQKGRLLKDNISEKDMCNMVSKDKSSWIEDKQKCSREITNYTMDSFITFNEKCKAIKGNIEIVSENTVCKFHNYFIPADKDSYTKLDKIIQWQNAAILEAEKFKSIKELCQIFEDSTYDGESRSCKFKMDKEIPYEYLFLEKIIREKDNQVYKNEQVEKDNIKNWENEAKNWKGSLDDLCENLTDSKSNFDEKTLGCKTYWKKEIKKYEIMKPLLIEQHKKITEQRNKVFQQKENEEKEKEIQIQKEWERRIGKSQEIIGAKNFILGDRSFMCESYKTYIFYFPKKIKLDLGFNTIQINGSMLFNYVDGYKDYFLYQGYDKDYKIISLKVYRESLLKTTPYSLDIGGLGYYCELIPK